jgi:hypothetical protein
MKASIRGLIRIKDVVWWLAYVALGVLYVVRDSKAAMALLKVKS